MVADKAKIARVLGANDKVQKEKCCILIPVRKTRPDSCSMTISGEEQPNREKISHLGPWCRFF